MRVLTKVTNLVFLAAVPLVGLILAMALVTAIEPPIVVAVLLLLFLAAGIGSVLVLLLYALARD